MRVRTSAVGLTLLGLVVSVTLFGAASLGLAGSGPTPSRFDVFVQPNIVTAGATGFAKGTFTAATGSGTGSATHVTITLDLPPGLLTPTSTNCSGPSSSADHTGYNRFTCEIGTVNAGHTVNRFVTFTAPAFQAPPPPPPPPDPNVYTVYGFVTFDNGNAGAPGGGSIGRIDDSEQTTVVSSTSSSRAGRCLPGATSNVNNVFTPPVSSTNPVSTYMSFGAASFFLPCTWAAVGENPHAGFIIPEISFVSAPVFANLATLKISIYQLPLSKIGTLTEFPNYPDNLSGSLPVLSCPSPTSLPTGRDACELPRSKIGNVTVLTLLFSGTGGDPGFGGG